MIPRQSRRTNMEIVECITSWISGKRQSRNIATLPVVLSASRTCKSKMSPLMAFENSGRMSRLSIIYRSDSSLPRIKPHQRQRNVAPSITNLHPPTSQQHIMPDLHSLPEGTYPSNAIRNNGPDNLLIERFKLRELAEGWPCYRYVYLFLAPLHLQRTLLMSS